MGFKCPACGTDFGQDKRKWEEHVKTAHSGAAQIIVNVVRNTCERFPCFGTCSDAKTKCWDCEAAQECYQEKKRREG